MRELNELQAEARRDLNNAVCLMGVIPFLIFLYILVVKVGTFEMLTRNAVKYFMSLAIIIFISGIFTGRRMLLLLISNLIDFSKQILKMQNELVEKNRLAAITETVLTLGHEINNPLLTVNGNLELLESDFKGHQIPDAIKNRVATIKNHCERISEVTAKISSLSKPASAVIHGESKMIDLDKSV